MRKKKPKKPQQCTKHSPKITPHSFKNAPKVQHKCTQNTAKITPKSNQACRKNATKIAQKTAQKSHFKKAENAPKISEN